MSNVIEEMEKELAIISETAKQITHERFGVDLTRKQLHRISKALSRYQSDKVICVNKEKLKYHIHDCYHCPIAPCLPLEHVGYSELKRRLSEDECFEKYLDWLQCRE